MISHAMQAKQKAKELLYWSQDWERLKRDRTVNRRPLMRFHAANRKAALLQRTPPWADMDAIKAVYERAHELARETGIDYVVDHIAPLQGATVCGLHVAGNLRIITATENSQKRNRFDESDSKLLESDSKVSERYSESQEKMAEWTGLEPATPGVTGRCEK